MVLMDTQMSRALLEEPPFDGRPGARDVVKKAHDVFGSRERERQAEQVGRGGGRRPAASTPSMLSPISTGYSLRRGPPRMKMARAMMARMATIVQKHASWYPRISIMQSTPSAMPSSQGSTVR